MKRIFKWDFPSSASKYNQRLRNLRIISKIMDIDRSS